MRHVLIDDPQSMRPAAIMKLVDLSQRAQIAQRVSDISGAGIASAGTRHAYRGGARVCPRAAGRAPPDRRRAESPAARGRRRGAQRELRHRGGRAGVFHRGFHQRRFHQAGCGGLLVLQHLAEFRVAAAPACAGGAARSRRERRRDGSPSALLKAVADKIVQERPCRKRTSVFDGCTLTSTSSASHSKNSSANG